MTQVDSVPQAPGAYGAKPTVPNEATGEFRCTACAESFATSADHRAHFKSERHVYNTKRKQAGLKPISQEAWERKLRESREAKEQKGTAHLKAKKPSAPQGTPGAFGRKPSEDNSELPSAPPSEGYAAAETEPEAPLTPRSCLFDRKHFDSIELCLAYMEKTHSFFIPDQEYVADVPALLCFLHAKISEGNTCINCNRRFPDMASTRRHMVDKGHCQLGSEAKTRRGNVDEAGTDELQEELEPFYDYHGSVREVAEKIRDPKQMVASILRFFDEDKDQKLGPDEVKALWMAANDGVELSEAQYEGACAKAGANPKEGLDVEELGKLYADGFADLSAHFVVLQDLLVKKHTKPLMTTTVEEGDEDAEDEENDDDEESESEDGEDDQIVECDNEDDFAEVMRVLGMSAVTLTETGDLKLPNGATAAHRDVAYIYRQRGVRKEQLEIVGGDRVGGGSKGFRKRCVLMLSNSSSGCEKMAMTSRQHMREGKRIIAVLRRQANYEMRLGCSMNVVNKKNTAKIRTGRGDCSNGR